MKSVYGFCPKVFVRVAQLKPMVVDEIVNWKADVSEEVRLSSIRV